MQELRRLLGVVALVTPLSAAVGCAKTEVTRIAEPVGPSPTAPSLLDEGRLVVHTDVRKATRGIEDPYASPTSWSQPMREGYVVYDLRGNVVASVGDIAADAAPAPVKLQAGDYTVRARGLNGRVVEFQAHIAPARTTEVFLDRTLTPADSSAMVRAPDGTVVGWRANAIGGGPEPER